MKKQRTMRILSVITALTLLLANMGVGFILPTKASGFNLTVQSSATGTSSSENVTLVFTPTTAMPSGTVLSVTWPSAYSGGAGLLDANVTVTGTNITGSSENGFTATGFNSTIASSANVTTQVTIVISGLTTPANPGNYQFSITTSVGDFGAALQYIGEDNIVEVTAEVSPLLSFSIRTSDDMADNNVCELGYLSLTSVNTCAYRLKVTTNAFNGYTVYLNTSGDLERVGSGGNVADANDIDLVVDNATVTAGVEGYGISFNGGASTVGSITEQGVFATDDTPLPFSNTSLYSSSGSNNPGASDLINTALVTHKAAASGKTNTGNYTQNVIYTVTASF